MMIALISTVVALAAACVVLHMRSRLLGERLEAQSIRLADADQRVRDLTDALASARAMLLDADRRVADERTAARSAAMVEARMRSDDPAEVAAGLGDALDALRDRL